MKARVYFHTPDSSGNFEVSDWEPSFEEWINSVGEVTAASRGWGYLVAGQSIPLRYITRIEKLED